MATQQITALRDRLIEVGYTREALRRLGAFSGEPIDREAAITATGDRSNISILCRLFFLRVSVAIAIAEQALISQILASLIKRGILTLQDGAIISECAIIPIGGLYTLRDFEPNETGKPLRNDHVLGVGKATSILSMLTVRRKVDSALDIGTGQGFHALVAAGSHAGHVLGTDINNRALWMAKLSAELNGVENVTFVDGSLFEPIKEDDRFGLIISNPPFIISPPHSLVCLGGGASGDGLVQAIISKLPQHLEEGGYACIMCNWYHDGGQWAARPRSWLPKGAKCDCWLIETRRETADEYIDGWMNEATFEGNDGASITAGAWKEYLQSLGASNISLGCMILRKRSGGEALGLPTPANWFRADTLDIQTCANEAGTQIERIFANQTLLANIPSIDALLDLPLRLTPTAELMLTSTPSMQGWRAIAATLRQTDGFEFTLEVDPNAAELLGSLASVASARAAAVAMAQRLGSDPQRALAAAGPFLAQMLSSGYLTY